MKLSLKYSTLILLLNFWPLLVFAQFPPAKSINCLQSNGSAGFTYQVGPRYLSLNSVFGTTGTKQDPQPKFETGQSGFKLSLIWGDYTSKQKISFRINKTSQATSASAFLIENNEIIEVLDFNCETSDWDWTDQLGGGLVATACEGNLPAFEKILSDPRSLDSRVTNYRIELFNDPLNRQNVYTCSTKYGQERPIFFEKWIADERRPIDFVDPKYPAYSLFVSILSEKDPRYIEAFVKYRPGYDLSVIPPFRFNQLGPNYFELRRMKALAAMPSLRWECDGQEYWPQWELMARFGASINELESPEFSQGIDLYLRRCNKRPQLTSMTGNLPIAFIKGMLKRESGYGCEEPSEKRYTSLRATLEVVQKRAPDFFKEFGPYRDDEIFSCIRESNNPTKFQRVRDVLKDFGVHEPFQLAAVAWTGDFAMYSSMLDDKKIYSYQSIWGFRLALKCAFEHLGSEGEKFLKVLKEKQPSVTLPNEACD